MITETDRLRVRALALDDAEFILSLTNEPAFIANIGDKGVRSLDDARRFLAEGAWTNQPRPGHGQFLVELKIDGRPIGVCGLLYRERLDVTDVGFAFLSAYQGRGYAVEAARAVVDYGHRVLGIESIVGLASESNAASVRVLEKLGMRFQRVVKIFGDDHATGLYARVRGDHPPTPR
jgi:RimJ/RimL family protein N-acetyltransferase